MKKKFNFIFVLFIFLFPNIGNATFEQDSADSFYKTIHESKDVDLSKLTTKQKDQYLFEDLTIENIKKQIKRRISPIYVRELMDEEAQKILELTQQKAKENLEKIEAEEAAAQEKTMAESKEKSEAEAIRIRNAIENMAKESSYFPVTGKKKKIFKKDEKTGEETVEIDSILDPTLGLRATEYSHEAELTFGGEDSETNLLTRLISLAMRFMGTMVILFFVIAGFFMITSRGDENQLQKGKTIFTYTLIGAFVAFTSYIVVQFIVNILFISS